MKVALLASTRERRRRSGSGGGGEGGRTTTLINRVVEIYTHKHTTTTVAQTVTAGDGSG